MYEINTNKIKIGYYIRLGIIHLLQIYGIHTNTLQLAHFIYYSKKEIVNRGLIKQILPP